MRIFTKISLLSLFLILAVKVSAQTAIMPNNDAGAIDKTSMEPISEDFAEENVFEKKNKTTFAAGVLKEEHDEVPRGPSFQVDKITFDGNTIISSEELSEIAKEIEGKEICFRELQEVVDKITELYHEKGYVTSEAFIPPQKVDKKIVEIGIAEGKYGEVNVTGNKWSSKEHISNILKANGVKKDDILNIYQLDHSLRDINQESYIEGKITVDRSKLYTTTSDVNLEIEDRFPLDFSVSWDDEGQDVTGEQRATLKATYNNITGKGDSASLGTVLSSGVFGIVSGYSLPLKDGKTKLNIDYSYSNSMLGDIFKEYEIGGNTHTYNVGLSRTLFKDKEWIVEADVGLEAKNSMTEMQRFDIKLSEYNLRTLKTGVTAMKKDKSGIWLSRAELRTGLPICNATEISEDYGYADSKYIKSAVNLNRYQRLPLGMMGILKTNFQYSPNKLLAPEKLSLGGSSTVRGYDPMLLMGDSGLNASFEVKKQLPFIDDLLPEKLRHLKGRFQVGCFYDCGYVRDMNTTFTPEDTNFLQSTGLSFYVPITKLMTVSLNAGMPIGAKVFDNQDVRFSFNLVTDIHEFWAKKGGKEEEEKETL